MEFMLQCRKFCPEIRVSRVANSGARTGMPSSERHTLGSKGEARDLTDKPRLPWPSLLHEHTSKANYHPSRPHRHTGPSGPEKCRGQGAATQTVRQYGKELQRRHRHFLRPAPPARCCSGQAGLQNVEGKARRRRQYASTARNCNAAIGIFSGSRLRPAVVRAKRACKMSRARRGDTDSTPIRQGASTPPSAFSQARVSGPLLSRL